MDKIKNAFDKSTKTTSKAEEKSPEFFKELKGFFESKEGQKGVRKETETTPKLETPRERKKTEGTTLKEKEVEKELGEEIKSGFLNLYRKFEQKIEEAKQEVSEFTDEVDRKLDEVKDDLKKDFEEKIEKPITHAAKEISEAFDKKVSQLENTISETVDEAKQTVDEVIKEADATLETIKADLEEAIEKGEQILGEAVSKVIETAEEVVEKLTDDVEKANKFISELIPESFREEPAKTAEEKIKRGLIEFEREVKRRGKMAEMEIQFTAEGVRTLGRVMPIVQKIKKISNFIDRIRKMLALMSLRIKNFYEDIRFYHMNTIQALKELNSNLKKEFLDAFE